MELRESALLDRPLRLQGRLRHPDATTLVREVETPYRERTTIRAERVEIARDGQLLRRFSLERAPELAGLLASFRALLGGDRALLEKHYALALESGAAAWTLTLTPRDPRLLERVSRVVLHGPTGELGCMELGQPDGGGSLLLLGANTEAAAQLQDPEALRRLCRGSRGGVAGEASLLVIPAKAGIHFWLEAESRWIPAFAGMTMQGLRASPGARRLRRAYRPKA